MSVLESGENYLEAILMLSKDKDGVHAIDVVNELGFSKPSVSIMLKKLKESGYITIDESNHLHLTETGLPIAEKIYERHLILTNILKYVGVNDKLAEEDACKLEHDISDESWEKIKAFYEEKIQK